MGRKKKKGQREKNLPFRGILCPECGGDMKKPPRGAVHPSNNVMTIYCGNKSCGHTQPALLCLHTEALHRRRLEEQRRLDDDRLIALSVELGNPMCRGDKIDGRLRPKDRKELLKALMQRKKAVEKQYDRMKETVREETQGEDPEARRQEFKRRLEEWREVKRRDKKTCQRKVSYWRRVFAEEIAAKALESRNIKLRVYHCLGCYCYHLTSMARPAWLPEGHDDES